MTFVNVVRYSKICPSKAPLGDKHLEKPLPTDIPCSGTRASTMLFPMQSLAKILSRDCVSTPPLSLSLVRATDLREATAVADAVSGWACNAWRRGYQVIAAHDTQ